MPHAPGCCRCTPRRAHRLISSSVLGAEALIVVDGIDVACNVKRTFALDVAAEADIGTWPKSSTSHILLWLIASFACSGESSTPPSSPVPYDGKLPLFQPPRLLRSSRCCCCYGTSCCSSSPYGVDVLIHHPPHVTRF